MEKKFKLLEKVATADIAFEAYGKEISGLFENSALATTSVMVDLDTLSQKIKKTIKLENQEIERLLFDFLNELVFLKDADLLLFKDFKVNIKKGKGKFVLTANLSGDRINPKKQDLKIDIKAVTMHMFRIEKKKDRYVATVVLDI